MVGASARWTNPIAKVSDEGVEISREGGTPSGSRRYLKVFQRLQGDSASDEGAFG
jgi:hypothetical protein